MKLALLLAVAVLAAPRLTCAAAIAAPEPEIKPLEYFLVVTGGELLEGVYPDAHTPYLTRALRPLGCQCVGSITVDDRREDIQQALRFATNRASLVLITGGLGPTPNDLTRETLAEFTGISLREDPAVLADMERRFSQPRDKLRPNLRRQALVPVTGGYLKNPAGTAVGLVFELGHSVLVALPGPPRELQAVVETELTPFLRQRFGVRHFGCSRTLRFVGAGQSLIDQTIHEHVAVDPDVVITSLFEGGRVDFTFSLPGNGAPDCARLTRLTDRVREYLADYIYAEDTSSLEEVILDQLRARGGSLVLVEIGTGGVLAGGLSAARSGHSILAGGYVALNDAGMAKLLRVPVADLPESPLERAKSLGLAAADKTGSNWAIATSALISDDKGQFVWVAYKLGHDSWLTQRLPLRDLSEGARATVRTQVLDFLRRHLRSMPDRS